VLVQIGAKIGGEPWIVEQLPFTDQPTMLCSYDVYGRTTLGILGFVATFNRSFGKYFSTVRQCGTAKVDTYLSECMVDALKNVSKFLTIV
jgi:hypothetical protein